MVVLFRSNDLLQPSREPSDTDLLNGSKLESHENRFVFVDWSRVGSVAFIFLGAICVLEFLNDGIFNYLMYIDMLSLTKRWSRNFRFLGTRGSEVDIRLDNGWPGK